MRPHWNREQLHTRQYDVDVYDHARLWADSCTEKTLTTPLSRQKQHSYWFQQIYDYSNRQGGYGVSLYIAMDAQRNSKNISNLAAIQNKYNKSQNIPNNNNINHTHAVTATCRHGSCLCRRIKHHNFVVRTNLSPRPIRYDQRVKGVYFFVKDNRHVGPLLAATHVFTQVLLAIEYNYDNHTQSMSSFNKRTLLHQNRMRNVFV